MSGQWNVIDVLAQGGPARDAFCAAIDAPEGDDVGLVRAVLANLAPGVVRAPVRELADLAAVVRALGACVDRRIDVEDLRVALEARALVSAEFARLGPARVLLRTVRDVLADPALEARRVRAQLAVLRRQLVAELAEQLTGDVDGAPAPRGSELRAAPVVPAGAREVLDASEAARLDAAAAECIAGPPGYSGGIRALAWVRGWHAVPIAGGAFGEGASGRAVDRLLALPGVGDIAQVRRAPESRYRLAATTLTLAPGWRAAMVAAPDRDALLALVERPRSRCVLLPAAATAGGDTPGAPAFAIVEEDEHHVIAGPAEVVECITGRSRAESLGAFREWVESLVVDDEEPPELAEVARVFGQLRRRAGT